MFKQIWKGWTIGVSIIFIPFLILSALLQADVPKSMIFAIPLVPVIAALQGVLIAAVICLGLKVLSFRNQS